MVRLPCPDFLFTKKFILIIAYSRSYVTCIFRYFQPFFTACGIYSYKRNLLLQVSRRIRQMQVGWTDGRYCLRALFQP